VELEYAVSVKMRPGIRAFTIVALCVTGARPASADQAKEEAKRRVEAATELHQRGKFAEALDELTVAYTLDPQPPLLYALGQLNVKLGRCPMAITFYERFIAANPPPDKIALAQRAIEVCKTDPPPPEVGTEPSDPPPPPEPPPPPPDPTPAPPAAVTTRSAWYADPLGGALVGAGMISLAVAGVQYRAVHTRIDEANAASTYGAGQRLVDRAHTARTLSVVFGAGGVALIAAGVVRLVVRDRGGASAEAVTVAPVPGGAVAVWGGSF
jgi:tetratricopeptide (TPR) repeat protein